MRLQPLTSVLSSSLQIEEDSPRFARHIPGLSLEDICTWQLSQSALAVRRGPFAWILKRRGVSSLSQECSPSRVELE